jgi:hypothetical protein
MKNLLSSVLLLAVISLGLTACWPAQTYDNNGLSFNYPGGWTITDDEFANQRGYLSLSKDGADPAATITFGWMVSDAQIGADMMIGSVFQGMQLTESLENLKTEPATDATYGDYPARAVTYTATVGGKPVSGAVWVFKAEGRVVNVAVREGAGQGNAGDFKKIKDSFKLK